MSDQNEPQPVPQATTSSFDSKQIPTSSHMFGHQEKPLLCTGTHMETLKTNKKTQKIAFWQL